MLAEITPLILTYNEAPNIDRTLEKLEWAKDILVVDSFSDDETHAIVEKHEEVRMLLRRFDNFASQCNYGLENGEIKTEWVLNLDADYVLTDEFIEELKDLKPSSTVSGYQANFDYCINGKALRSGIYPPVTVLFRRSQGRFVSDGHAHRVVVQGEVVPLKSKIRHDDRKAFKRWFQSQLNYTRVEAGKLLQPDVANLDWVDRLRRWIFIAPPAIFFYCLIVKGGILDGWRGLYYAWQRSIAEALLSLRLLERVFVRPKPEGEIG